MADYFYAVRIGRVPGVYKSWAECSEQVFKFPGAKYKKFSTLSLAQEFISQAHHSGIQNPNYESHNLVKKTREKKSKKENN